MAFPAGGGFSVDSSSGSGSGSGISSRGTYGKRSFFDSMGVTMPLWVEILLCLITIWSVIYIVVCLEVAMRELHKLPGGSRVTYGKVYRRALSLATGFALVAWIFRKRPAGKDAIATNSDIESARRNRELSSRPRSPAVKETGAVGEREISHTTSV